MSYYKSIFKNFPFTSLLLEKKKDIFVIKEANNLFCQVTKKNAEELIGKVVEEVFPENPFSPGLNEVQESFKTAFTSQKPHKIDVLRYDLQNEQNGLYELKYWEIENIPILDEAENIWYVLNVVKDITVKILERDRDNILQLKLDAKTEKHEQLTEKITDGLFSLDREGYFVSLNNGLSVISETAEADLLKMNLFHFCGLEHRDEIVKKFNAAIGGTNQKFEANFISGKGKNVVLDISLVPFKSDGIITGLYGVIKDINRLKDYEDALLQSGKKFKALVQEGFDLIGILDLEGKYKFVSETSSSLLGIEPMDFIGRSAFEFIHPADKDRVINEFSVLEEKNQIQIKPFRFKNSQGEWRWVETKASNLINDPAIEGIITNSRDVTDHINSQKAIKESEERYRSFFENSTDAVLVTIPDGKILAANPSACKMFQRSEKELCLLGREAVTDPLDPRLSIALKLRRETGSATAELTFVRKDGTNFPGEITSSIFKDSEGNSRSSMIIRDISERKIAENAIKESEEKYRSFFENSLDGILLTASDGRILAANTSACQMFQRTEKEICEVGRAGVFDISDPRVARALKERSNTGKVMAEVNMVRKDRSIFPAALSSAIFEDANFEKFASMIIRDISEAKLAEEELKASETKYKNLFENNPLPNIIYDNDTFEILDVNNSATDYYGFSRKELLELTILDFLPKEDIPNIKKTISNLPKKGEVSHNRGINLKKNGEKMQVEYFGYSLTYKERNCRLAICLDITEREVALQNLTDKTEKLLTAQRIAKLGYWTHNLENDNIFWSEEVFNICERDNGAFQPNLPSYEETIHPEDLKPFREACALAINGEKELDFEHRIIMPNGKIKWVHVKGKLNKNKNENAVLEGTVQDITERRNNLEKIVISEARFKGLIQSQTNYVIRTDLQGRYTYGNKKFRDDFGWIHGEKEIVGQDSMASINEYHHSRVHEAAESCLANPDQVFQVEIDKPARGGGVKTTLWDIIYLKGTALEPDEIQCVGIDISDRVKAEAENRFQAGLLDKINQAVLATDIEGKIIYWNQGANMIYGWEAEEVLGKNIMDVTPTDNHEQASEIMKALGEGKMWEGEFKVRRKDGTTFPAYVANSVVFDPKGNLTAIIGISSDMTERKKADDELRGLNEDLKKYTEELVEANKGLEQFSFIVSHNLRSPVANIIGLADLIGNKEYPEDVKNNFQEALLDNVKRLDLVISDLNAILQVKVEMDGKKEPVLLNNLVEAIKISIQNLIQKEKVQITTHFDVPAIHTVQSYLHSIFYNLIANSIKYRRPGIPPQIGIKSENKKGSLVITFEDNGLGIDLVKRGEQVFGLYKRFHNHIEGKGMGLFLVKTQVELLGGKISIESEVNAGTKFTITFKENTFNYTS